MALIGITINIYFEKLKNIYFNLSINNYIYMSQNIVSYDFFNKKVINIINAIQNYKKATMETNLNFY